MNTEQEMVMAFHAVFDCPIAGSPTLLDLSRRDLRIELITEELHELSEAFDALDIVAIADALGDLLYVVYGAAVESGIDMAPVVAEIHRSNMTKRGGGVRSDGKVLKPKSYEPPNLGRVLAEQV